MLKLNIGCYKFVHPDYVNIDIHPYILLARHFLFARILNLVGFLDSKKLSNIKEFIPIEKFITLKSVTKRIPYSDNSVDVIYSSHFIEHISRKNAEFFIRDSFRALKPHGIFRIVVPCLKTRVESYHNGTMTADEFLDSLELSYRQDPSLSIRLWALLSGSGLHKWMYDSSLLHKLCSLAGFKTVEEKKFKESKIPEIDQLDLDEHTQKGSYGSFYIEALK